MARGLILSGGPTHDFPALSARLATLLSEVGVVADVTDEPEAVPAMLADVDLLVVNALRWQMGAERYSALRAELGYSPSEEFRSAVTAFVANGGGLIAMHTASICFDDWPGWAELIGARWDWQTSSHPPVGPARVDVRPDVHPIVTGMATSFDTDDEIYGFLDLQPDVDPLMLGRHSDADHPLAWARTVGRGRVVHNALGHHLVSYEPDEMQTFVRRSALWCLGAADSEVRVA